MARLKDPHFNGLRECCSCMRKDRCTDAFCVIACDRYVSSYAKPVKRKRRKIQHIEDYELPKYVYE